MKSEAIILSPKNLYRVISGRMDGTKYTKPLNANAGNGLSLVRFWRDILSGVLSDELIRALLPDDGTHPRSQSSLMNRSGINTMPMPLRRELDENLNGSVFAGLVSNCMCFLSDRKYNSGNFRSSFRAFEDQCISDDVSITPSLAGFLRSLRDPALVTCDDTLSDELFIDGYRLSWLCLCALFGSHMGSEAFSVLRRDPGCSPLEVRRVLNKSTGINVLTSRDCALCGEPLAQSEYIPLEITPEAVAYQLNLNGKLFISGTAGSGKTELLRQALRLIKDSGCYDRIAYVQYSGDPERSLLTAFAGRAGTVGDIRRLLEQNTGHKTLLCIDGINAPHRMLERLSLYACDIVIAGRITDVSGFKCIRVPCMPEPDAVELFVRGCLEGLSEGAEKLARYYEGHPFTMKLLSRICSEKHWSAGKLAEYTAEEGLFGLPGADAMKSLISPEELDGDDGMLLKLISLLRSCEHTPEIIKKLYGANGGNTDNIENRLYELYQRGYLAHSAGGYGMHPALAEGIRCRGISCDSMPGLWKHLSAEFESDLTPESQAVSPDILFALGHVASYNRDAVDTLVRLESSAMSRPISETPDSLFTKHREWLDSNPHEEVDEIDYNIGTALISILKNDHSRYKAAVSALSGFSPSGFDVTEHFALLCNVLEVGGGRAEPAELDSLFELLRPREKSRRLIVYLNFLGGKYRSIDKDTASAIRVLTEARDLIEELGFTGEIEEAANDTRMAYSLADLNRYTEAVPLMRRVLDSLKKRGYTEDSGTYAASKRAYMFFLSKCGEFAKNRGAMEAEMQRMRENGTAQSSEFLMAAGNYCMLMNNEGLASEAEAVSREIIDIVRTYEYSHDPTPANTLVHAADILRECGHTNEALGIYSEAGGILEHLKLTGSASFMRCKIGTALCLRDLGHREAARSSLTALLDNCPETDAETIKRYLAEIE